MRRPLALGAAATVFFSVALLCAVCARGVGGGHSHGSIGSHSHFGVSHPHVSVGSHPHFSPGSHAHFGGSGHAVHFGRGGPGPRDGGGPGGGQVSGFHSGGVYIHRHRVRVTRHPNGPEISAGVHHRSCWRRRNGHRVWVCG
jgi:hypothetical protein